MFGYWHDYVSGVWRETISQFSAIIICFKIIVLSRGKRAKNDPLRVHPWVLPCLSPHLQPWWTPFPLNPPTSLDSSIPHSVLETKLRWGYVSGPLRFISCVFLIKLQLPWLRVLVRLYNVKGEIQFPPLEIARIRESLCLRTPDILGQEILCSEVHPVYPTRCVTTSLASPLQMPVTLPPPRRDHQNGLQKWPWWQTTV